MLAVLGHNSADRAGGPLAGPLDLVDRTGQLDNVVLVNGLLDRRHDLSSLWLRVGGDKARRVSRVADQPGCSDIDDALSVSADASDWHIHEADDTIGGAVSDVADRHVEHAGHDLGFEVVDCLN